MSMIKNKKRNFTSIVVLLMTASMLVSGCASETQYEVANYQGKLAEGETSSDYDKELFYRNDQKTSGADPFVMDNTERDGYYYLYVTKGSVYCYRSTNMMDWEPVGNALDNLKYESQGVVSEFRKATYGSIWAPEVVYDSDMETYYMFFSAKPQEDTSVESKITGEEFYLLMIASSKYPDRGFQLVDFTDASSCGAENVRKYNTTAYPQYYAKYSALDMKNLYDFCIGDKTYDAYGGYVSVIDPHPFVDDNGDKYLFFTDMLDINRIGVVKMTNWLTPDWSTAEFVLWANYYTGEDYKASKNGQHVETVPYEMEDKGCNEGPAVIKHNGKYYMTFSVNFYQDDSYQVVQAVADSPTGPYRKLTEAEGGIVVSGETSGSMEVSGTGHHSMISVGEQMFIVYHKHDAPEAGGSERHHSIDEIKWITIKDKDGNDLDVMYTNGPTCTVQPKIETYSEYKNIADEAKVTVAQETNVENLPCLTDGLLSIYKYANEDFMQYFKETSISETATFSFDFDEVREVRAIMVYNSKWHMTCFRNISEVKLICEENGEEVIRYIDNIEFSSEYYDANGLDGSIYYITPGAAAYAEFEGLIVKTIEITVDVPEGQESVGISEIRILGK